MTKKHDDPSSKNTEETVRILNKQNDRLKETIAKQQKQLVNLKKRASFAENDFHDQEEKQDIKNLQPGQYNFNYRAKYGFVQKGIVSSKEEMKHLSTFSDAVVAIAITLIVVPLINLELKAKSGLYFFTTNTTVLVAAAYSFFALALIWRNHAKIHDRARGYTNRVFWLEIIWLLGVVFLPVATVLNFSDFDRVTLAVYSGNFLVNTLAIRFQVMALKRANAIRGDSLNFWQQWRFVLFSARCSF